MFTGRTKTRTQADEPSITGFHSWRNLYNRLYNLRLLLLMGVPVYLLFMALAGIADLVTTWIALKDGATEQNPIAKLFGESDRAVMYTAAVSKMIGILIVGLVLKGFIASAVAILIGLIWLIPGAFNNAMRTFLQRRNR